MQEAICCLSNERNFLSSISSEVEGDRIEVLRHDSKCQTGNNGAEDKDTSYILGVPLSFNGRAFKVPKYFPSVYVRTTGNNTTKANTLTKTFLRRKKIF